MLWQPAREQRPWFLSLVPLAFAQCGTDTSDHHDREPASVSAGFGPQTRGVCTHEKPRRESGQLALQERSDEAGWRSSEENKRAMHLSFPLGNVSSVRRGLVVLIDLAIPAVRTVPLFSAGLRLPSELQPVLRHLKHQVAVLVQGHLTRDFAAAIRFVPVFGRPVSVISAHTEVSAEQVSCFAV